MGCCQSHPPRPLTEQELLWILSIPKGNGWLRSNEYLKLRSLYRTDMEVLEQLEKSTRLATLKASADTLQKIKELGDSAGYRVWFVETVLEMRDMVLREIWEPWSADEEKEFHKQHGAVSKENFAIYWRMRTQVENYRVAVMNSAYNLFTSGQYLTKDDIFTLIIHNGVYFPEKYYREMKKKEETKEETNEDDVDLFTGITPEPPQSPRPTSAFPPPIQREDTAEPKASS